MALPILRRGGSPVRPTGGQAQTSPFQRMDPWNDFEVMTRLFDSAFPSPLAALGRSLGQALPQDSPFELYETADELLAYIYAPGLSADSFDISVSGDILTIKAERKPLLDTTEGLTSHTPWSSQTTSMGTFTASYNLPVEIDTTQVQASYKDGVLHVRMPKSEATKPRQVKVEVSKS